MRAHTIENCTTLPCHLMKIILLIPALYLLALSSLLGAERFPWLQDLDQARKLAIAEDKPLLIVFRCEP